MTIDGEPRHERPAARYAVPTVALGTHPDEGGIGGAVSGRRTPRRALSEPDRAGAEPILSTVDAGGGVALIAVAAPGPNCARWSTGSSGSAERG